VEKLNYMYQLYFIWCSRPKKLVYATTTIKK